MEENQNLWYVGPTFPLPIIYCNRKKIATMSRDLPIELREEYAHLIVDAVNVALSTQKDNQIANDTNLLPTCKCGKVMEYRTHRSFRCQRCGIVQFK